jgi:hypothetical protein
MGSHYLRIFIIGGFVLLFGLLVFPPMHTAFSGISTAGLVGSGRFVDAAWITFQPYLLLGVFAYAIYAFTHRRG